MRIQLNGGNYGGITLTVPDETTKVAVKESDNSFWIYDCKIHVKTTTADFVGMGDSESPVLTDSLTTVVELGDLNVQGNGGA